MKKSILITILFLIPFSASALGIRSVSLNGESKYTQVKPGKGVSVDMVLKEDPIYIIPYIVVEAFPSDVSVVVDTAGLWKSNRLNLELATTSFTFKAPLEEGNYDIVVKAYDDINKNKLLTSWTGTDMLGVSNETYVKEEPRIQIQTKQPTIEELQRQIIYLLQIIISLTNQLHGR